MLPGAYPLVDSFSKLAEARGESAALAVENDGEDAPVETVAAGVDAAPPGSFRPDVVGVVAIVLFPPPGVGDGDFGVKGLGLDAPPAAALTDCNIDSGSSNPPVVGVVVGAPDAGNPNPLAPVVGDGVELGEPNPLGSE